MNRQLTDEEIEELSDTQLRILCGQLQGYTDPFVDSDGDVVVHNPRTGCGCRVPDYPYDLSTAWSLFEPFQAKGRSVGMRSRGFRHQAFIYDGPGSDWIPSDDDLYAEADLPGRAICRVVLKASRSNR